MPNNYEVSSFDVCASGFERLRNQDEFILLASINANTEAKSLAVDWLSDIQSCEPFDGFDYEAATKTVNKYWLDVVLPLFSRRANPFNLEPGRDDIGYDEGCTAFLYIRVS